MLTDNLCSFNKIGMLLTKEDTIEVRLEEKWKKKGRKKINNPKQKMSLVRVETVDLLQSMVNYIWMDTEGSTQDKGSRNGGEESDLKDI